MIDYIPENDPVRENLEYMAEAETDPGKRAALLKNVSDRAVRPEELRILLSELGDANVGWWFDCARVAKLAPAIPVESW